MLINLAPFLGPLLLRELAHLLQQWLRTMRCRHIVHFFIGKVLAAKDEEAIFPHLF
jgi:hypothetical protein